MVVCYQRYAGQCCHFVSFQGGIAAGDGNARRRVDLMQLSDGLAALARGLYRDRTGIKEDHLCVLGGGDNVVPGSLKAPGQCVIFAEVEAAAQLFQKDAHGRKLVMLQVKAEAELSKSKVTIQVRRIGQESTRQSHLISASASHLYSYKVKWFGKDGTQYSTKVCCKPILVSRGLEEKML